MNAHLSNGCSPFQGGKYTLSCPPELAQFVREVVMEHGLFDPARSIGRNGMVYFPLILFSEKDMDALADGLGDLSGKVRLSRGTEGTSERTPLRTPRERVLELLHDSLSREELDLIPSAYERLGDCLVLRIDERLDPHLRKIASAFAGVLGSRYVLRDVSGVRGELREPTMEVLIPPADRNFEVLHKEGNFRFMFDPTRIMFSSGNTEERSRFADNVTRTGDPPGFSPCGEVKSRGAPEIVVDMFAGIGYFTIPLAVGAKNDMRIIAVEKNPVSFGYLKRNIEMNHVKNRVVPLLGDNRTATDDDIADRIIMGYVGGTAVYLDRALEISRPEGSIIHFHDTVEVEKGINGLFRDLVERASGTGYDLDLISSHRVKSFAPRIDHVELDLIALPS